MLDDTLRMAGKLMRSSMSVLRVLLIASLFAVGSTASAMDNSDIQAEMDALTPDNIVIVGAYFNKLQDVDLKAGKFTIDFYVWFRWKPVGKLEDYDPLASFELINGRVDSDSKSNVVTKDIEGERYTSARLTATIYKNWGLKTFPFDQHKVGVVLEDSQFDSRVLRFEPDRQNSLKGDEISLPGWKFSGFESHEALHTYLTNYGDTSDSRTGTESYSRVSFEMDMRRSGWGTPFKLLSTALIAAFVAFIAFGVRPGNVDPRFGLGVGALFAVTTNSFVVAELVPTSGLLTIADQVHLVTAWFIFASLVQSAFCLKWEEAGEAAKRRRADFWSRIVFPLLYLAAVGWLISAAATRGGAD